MAQSVGMIGLGAMGGPMARNLVAAGIATWGYDIDEQSLAACTAAGVKAAKDPQHLAARVEIIMTSLPSPEIWGRVAAGQLLPVVRPGQTVVDLGTSRVEETRRLAADFAKRGAVLLDIPVSGGPAGALAGRLRMFAGGDEEAVNTIRPILTVLGDPDRIVYFGPSGAGQLAKAVNQLAMGLNVAAHLEALAFGVRTGLDPEALARAVGADDGWRKRFAWYAGRITEGTVTEADIKSPELDLFLAVAEQEGFDLPMTRALQQVVEGGEKVSRGGLKRPRISFWHELMRRPW